MAMNGSPHFADSSHCIDEIALPSRFNLNLYHFHLLATFFNATHRDLTSPFLLDIFSRFLHFSGHLGCSTLCVMGEANMSQSVGHDTSRHKAFRLAPIAGASLQAQDIPISGSTPPRSMSSFILECRCLPYRSTPTIALVRRG